MLLFVTALLMSLVSASPVLNSDDLASVEPRASPKCKTLYSGTLTTRELTKGYENDEHTCQLPLIMSHLAAIVTSLFIREMEEFLAQP